MNSSLYSVFLLSSSAEANECAADVLKTWRDKEDTEANMAALEKALRDMGREDIVKNFKQLAYSSYSKDPVIIVETFHISSTPEKDSTDGSSAGRRRISEYLDAAGETDCMFEDGGSPRISGLEAQNGDEVFGEAKRSSPEPLTEECDIVEEKKHKVVDEDANVQDGNEISKEDTEKLLQDFFGNDKGVLNFLSDDAPAKVENGNTEETEI